MSVFWHSEAWKSTNTQLFKTEIAYIIDKKRVYLSIGCKAAADVQNAQPAQEVQASDTLPIFKDSSRDNSIFVIWSYPVLNLENVAKAWEARVKISQMSKLIYPLVRLLTVVALLSDESAMYRKCQPHAANYKNWLPFM